MDEFGTKILDKDWNVEDLIAHIKVQGANVEHDNDGQIMLYTHLFIHRDGALYSEPE